MKKQNLIVFVVLIILVSIVFIFMCKCHSVEVIPLLLSFKTICLKIMQEHFLECIAIVVFIITICILFLYIYLLKCEKRSMINSILRNADWISAIVGLISFILSFFYGKNFFLEILIASYFTLLTLVSNFFKKSKLSYTFFKKYERIQKEFDECIFSQGGSIMLAETHIDKMLDNIVQDISHLHPVLLTTNAKHDSKDVFNLESFVHHIESNTKNYLLLCHDSKELYSKVFSNIYLNVFSKINEDFLSPLFPTGVEKYKFKAPKFLSNEISKALVMSEGFKSQYNTCTQSWEQFLDSIKEPIKDTKNDNTEKRFRRLFICSKIPELNDENVKKVVKWHMDNNWDIKYIQDNKIPPYDSSIQSKDFSVISINDSSYVLRIIGRPISEYIYNLKVNFYLVEISHCQKEVKTYNILFQELWDKAQELYLSN